MTGGEIYGGTAPTNGNNLFVGGNASLSLMHDLIARAYTHGLKDSPRPWCKEERIKFLCPSPGYDRHFKMTELFGFELISVPMTPTGPDMDMVEEYVNNDETVKGIWCVPLYSNPSGEVYSDETVKRFANLKPAAKDFRIFWDNAYCVHHLYPEKPAQILEILDECAKAGNPDMVYKFGSTAKVTFPGAGISAIATSKANLADMQKQMNAQLISHDKLNQLRHVKYFKNADGIRNHMKLHADILRPKFEIVINAFRANLTGIAQWTEPKGGYFVSYYAMEGTAKRALALCKEAGVVMTDAGATYPYGIDPQDTNIRIAPSLPPVAELEQAMEVFCLCLKIAAFEKELGL